MKDTDKTAEHFKSQNTVFAVMLEKLDRIADELEKMNKREHWRDRQESVHLSTEEAYDHFEMCTGSRPAILTPINNRAVEVVAANGTKFKVTKDVNDRLSLKKLNKDLT